MRRREKEEICVLEVIRKLWKVLGKSKNLEEAKRKFKDKVLEIIFEEE